MKLKQESAFGENTTFQVERGGQISVRRFRLVIVDSPAPGTPNLERGRTWESTQDGCTIGSHPSNDFVLPEEAVSRFHREIKIVARGPRIQDCGSRNGTMVDGVEVETAFLREGNILHIGRVALRFELTSSSNPMAISERTEFGGLVGTSIAMRSCFAELERAVGNDFTVVLLGETGTGKSTAAEIIHDRSQRCQRAFVTFDCGAIATNLLESDLFGSVKGAFSGAVDRPGVFEYAEGGTVFLDEIGELPLDLQTRLLRVVEAREVRRLGANKTTKIDVRILVGTHRDLRTEVNAGRFRSDLYFRLAVMQITLPPLRKRPEDIPALVNALLTGMNAPEAAKTALLLPETLAVLQNASWPGNIRELRNYVERCIAYEAALPILGANGEANTSSSVNAKSPFDHEREKAIETFERQYLGQLMRIHGDNVTRAAEHAGLTRQYLHRLLKKVGVG